MYNNPYINPYYNLGQQNLNENIDNQIAQLNKMKEQIKNNNNQPAINQTFQLAPNNQNNMKYANSIDEVNKELVINDTPFFSKDMSVLWVKSVKGDVKTYEINEVVLKDEKDIKIDFLMAQIEELKKEMKNNEPDDNVNGTIKDEEPTNVSSVSKFAKKSKQS